MAKIVVLGADGFIGKHLVRRLAGKKSDKIIAFDRFSAYKASGTEPFADLPNVEIMTGNFFNRGDLYEALYRADYVFHLISATTPAASSYDPFMDLDTNVRPSVELFELCVERGVRKLVFLSSGGAVYGDVPEDIVKETAVPAPRSPYGIGKVTIEHYLRYFKDAAGLDYVVYRVANPYGPGQNIHGRQGVIAIFIHSYLSHNPITVLGGGTMVRDYLYIDDLVSMILGSYRKKQKHAEYNLGSGRGTSVNELIEAIEDYTGQSAIKLHEDLPATYVQKSVLDISRFVAEYNIKPTVDLKNGIGRTWDYVKELT